MRNTPPRRSADKRLLKMFKDDYDKPDTLRRYTPALRRRIHFAPLNDERARGEVCHQLALQEVRDGRVDRALEMFEEAFKALGANNYLAKARVLRDHALALAVWRADHDVAMSLIATALDAHTRDAPNDKGRRQLAITENYARYIKLLANTASVDDQQQLIAFALKGCRGCHVREQEQAIEFGLAYACGMQLVALRARQAEIPARRARPIKTSEATLRLATTAQRELLKAAARTIFR